MIPVNCVVLGAPKTGKTSLLMSFDRAEFLNTSMPTELIVHKTLSQGKDQFHLKIYDPGPVIGSEGFLNRRELRSKRFNSILLCFDIGNRSSFQAAKILAEQIKTSLLPDIKAHLIVVGNKTDVRDDNDVLFEHFERGDCVMSSEEGRRFSDRIGAALYCETSALSQDGVDELFQNLCSLFSRPFFRSLSAFLPAIRFKNFAI